MRPVDRARVDQAPAVVASKRRSQYMRTGATWRRRSPVAWTNFLSAFFIGESDRSAGLVTLLHIWQRQGHRHALVSLRSPAALTSRRSDCRLGSLIGWCNGKAVGYEKRVLY